MVGIKTTFKVGDKEIEWKSVIKWLLDWAQKQEYEKKAARDSFVTSGKIIFEDIKWAWRREKNKELYAKLYHVASKCGLKKECVSWKESGKVLSDRIAQAKNKGSIGAYIDTFYQKDSDDWKNAYAAFDVEAPEQKERLKKSTGTDETKVVKPGETKVVKPGVTIDRQDKQEYDKRYRERKRQQGCVLGDACKCKGLAEQAMIRAPGKDGFIHTKCLKRTCAECKITGTADDIRSVSPNKPGEFVHKKCLKRTCAECKITGTAEDICMVSPNKPGEFVHKKCLDRTCAKCKITGTARDICMVSPNKPGEFVHKKCLDRTCAECKITGTAKDICLVSPNKPGEFVHPHCLNRTCAECKITGTAKDICMVSPNKPGEFVHRECLKRTCAKCKETGTARDICMVSPNKPGEHVHQKCLKRTCSFCGKKADARTIFRNRRCSTPGNPVFSCRSEACRFQFPFTDPNGCAFCGRKFTCSSISLDSMKRIIARHEMKIKPKRDACSECFWRKFHLHQAAKRDKELERIDKLTKKDMSKLYKKLRKLMLKMKRRHEETS
jgi:phage anti-repressor protein